MLNLQFCWLIPTFDAGIHSMHYNNNLKASWILLVGSPLLLVKSTCCWWLLAQIHVSNGQLDKEEAKQRRNTFLRRAWTTNEFPWVPMVSHGSTWYTWTKLLKHVETMFMSCNLAGVVKSSQGSIAKTMIAEVEKPSRWVSYIRKPFVALPSAAAM